MKAWRIVAGVAALMAVVTFGYALVYVARWEWRRATLVAVLAVLCTVVAFGVAVDARLRELNRRLAARASDGSPVDGTPVSPLDGSPRGRDTGRNRTFEWLQPPSDSFGVFIPVLLGMGIVVTALAWVLEHVAYRRGPDLAVGAAPALPETLVPPETATGGPTEPRARVVDAWLRRPGAG